MNVKQSVFEKEIDLYRRSPDDYKDMVLDTSTWQKYRLTKLFNVVNGRGTLQDTTKEGTVPIISSSKDNNGVSGYVEVAQFEGGKLTVAKNGSVGEIFFQYNPFSATSDVFVLTKKHGELTNMSALFLCTIFRQEQFKYNYGRKLNKDRIEEVVIKLPSKQVGGKWEPDYEYMENYIKTLAYSGCLESEISELLGNFGAISQLGKISTVRVWDRFRLEDLFDITYGKFISNNKEEEGVPYITTTAQNNGISGKVKGSPMYIGNCLTVASDGSVGETFYQEHPFSTSNIVSTLQPKIYFNKYIAFFITPLIKKDSYRYGYGRKFSVEKVRNTEIMLPSITLESGKVVPDYVFMEQYVKTLKYSKVL